MHNIFRVQDDDSMMRGFYVIAQIEYMLTGKTVLDHTNLFSPNDYKKNYELITNDEFKDKYGKS